VGWVINSLIKAKNVTNLASYMIQKYRTLGNWNIELWRKKYTFKYKILDLLLLYHACRCPYPCKATSLLDNLVAPVGAEGCLLDTRAVHSHKFCTSNMPSKLIITPKLWVPIYSLTLASFTYRSNVHGQPSWYSTSASAIIISDDPGVYWRTPSRFLICYSWSHCSYKGASSVSKCVNCRCHYLFKFWSSIYLRKGIWGHASPTNVIIDHYCNTNY